jgi:hypothetical protein
MREAAEEFRSEDSTGCHTQTFASRLGMRPLRIFLERPAWEIDCQVKHSGEEERLKWRAVVPEV